MAVVDPEIVAVPGIVVEPSMPGGEQVAWREWAPLPAVVLQMGSELADFAARRESLLHSPPWVIRSDHRQFVVARRENCWVVVVVVDNSLNWH